MQDITEVIKLRWMLAAFLEAISFSAPPPMIDAVIKVFLEHRYTLYMMGTVHPCDQAVVSGCQLCISHRISRRDELTFQASISGDQNTVIIE
jgi:hypothetical protein